jgi:hypothetical protein
MRTCIVPKKVRQICAMLTCQLPRACIILHNKHLLLPALAAEAGDADISHTVRVKVEMTTPDGSGRLKCVAEGPACHRRDR